MKHNERSDRLLLSPVHTSNNIQATLSSAKKSDDSFDKVECCFDNVAVFWQQCCAGFGNNVERNFVLSTKSKQIEHVQFVSTSSKGRYSTINSFDIVAVFRNKVECCFDKVACCFDIVAGVDGVLEGMTSVAEQE